MSGGDVAGSGYGRPMMKATSWWVLWVVVCSLVASSAMAQDSTEPTESAVSGEITPETAPGDAEPSAPTPHDDDPDEFGDGLAPVTTHVSTSAARDTLDAPRSRSALVPPPPDEVPEAAPYHRRPSDPLDGGAEVFVGVLPTLGLGAPSGGLGGLAGLEGGISGGADFVFAADRRTWLGFGLSLNHNESFGGAATQSRVSIPLIAQLYLDDPRRGEATPTLRITPSFRWEQFYSAGSFGYSRVGGALDVGVGITWFVTDFLAIRILGDVGAGVMVSYEGADSIGIAANVGANVGVVIRL